MATAQRATYGLQGDFAEAANAETGDVEAVILDIDVDAAPGYNGLEVTFSEDAEDAGITGAHDDTDGLIYEGPAEVYRDFAVEVTNLDVSEGAIVLPEESDEVTRLAESNQGENVY